MEYKVGDPVEIAHGKWRETYIVTQTAPYGYVQLRKMKLGKTKISFQRFPETITLRILPHPTTNSQPKMTKPPAIN